MPSSGRHAAIMTAVRLEVPPSVSQLGSSGECVQSIGADMKERKRNEITTFQTLKEALKAAEPIIKNPDELRSGKPLQQFGNMKPREFVGNVLLCLVTNPNDDEHRMTFAPDPDGGDGIITDARTGERWHMEHVYELGPWDKNPEGRRGEDLHDVILEAITHKTEKGASYARGKTLFVLCNEAGQWFPNRAVKRLSLPVHFKAILVAALQERTPQGAYVYTLTRLDWVLGRAPAWRLRIEPDFQSWGVQVIQ
jgi:hypothetical protein